MNPITGITAALFIFLTGLMLGEVAILPGNGKEPWTTSQVGAVALTAGLWVAFGISMSLAITYVEPRLQDSVIIGEKAP